MDTLRTRETRTVTRVLGALGFCFPSQELHFSILVMEYHVPGHFDYFPHLSYIVQVC